MSGIERIAAERKRQIEQEGWTNEHDDAYTAAVLPLAAAAYAHTSVILCDTPRGQRQKAFQMEASAPYSFWPFQKEWWKPSNDPIRNLEKAGALIAAEIDRLERAKQAEADHD